MTYYAFGNHAFSNTLPFNIKINYLKASALANFYNIAAAEHLPKKEKKKKKRLPKQKQR